MGITKEVAENLSNIVRETGANGKILTLGRQFTLLFIEDLFDLINRHQFGYFKDGVIGFNNGKTLENFMNCLNSNKAYMMMDSVSGKPLISGDLLLSALGFDLIESVDASPYEKSTYIHDLNILGLEKTTEKKYDFIFDGGTMEHVFHIPHVLENIFNTLNVGGYICHTTPINNFVDHGLYQICPTFFLDWYGANKWEIKKMIIKKSRTPNGNDGSDEIINYTQNPSNMLNSLDGSYYGLWFCARKTENSTCNVIPQQNYYVNTWGEFSDRRP